MLRELYAIVKNPRKRVAQTDSPAPDGSKSKLYVKKQWRKKPTWMRRTPVKERSLHLSMETDERVVTNSFLQAIGVECSPPPVDVSEFCIIMQESDTSSLHDEQLSAVMSVCDGHSTFITGQAGVGKSLVISTITKTFLAKGRPVLLMARTWAAAKVVGGKAIHKLMGILPHKTPEGKDSCKLQYRWSCITEIEDALRHPSPLIIVDEVSMLDSTLASAIEQQLLHVRERLLKKNPDESIYTRRIYGLAGIQTVFVGDFLQLPPTEVSTKQKPSVDSVDYERISGGGGGGGGGSGGGGGDEGRACDDEGAMLLCESPKWLSWLSHVALLSTQHRQNGDVQFAQILSAMRTGSLADRQLRRLNKRVGAPFVSHKTMRIYTNWKDAAVAESCVKNLSGSHEMSFTPFVNFVKRSTTKNNESGKVEYLFEPLEKSTWDLVMSRSNSFPITKLISSFTPYSSQRDIIDTSQLPVWAPASFLVFWAQKHILNTAFVSKRFQDTLFTGCRVKCVRNLGTTIFNGTTGVIIGFRDDLVPYDKYSKSNVASDEPDVIQPSGVAYSDTGRGPPLAKLDGSDTIVALLPMQYNEVVAQLCKATSVQIQVTALPWQRAHASTIHGVQGLTISGTIEVPNETSFEGGGYVAYSRVHSLADLSIRGGLVHSESFSVNPVAKAFYKALDQEVELRKEPVVSMHAVVMIANTLYEDE